MEYAAFGRHPLSPCTIPHRVGRLERMFVSSWRCERLVHVDRDQEGLWQVHLLVLQLLGLVEELASVDRVRVDDGSLDREAGAERQPEGPDRDHQRQDDPHPER